MVSEYELQARIYNLEERVKELEDLVAKIDRTYVPMNGNNH